MSGAVKVNGQPAAGAPTNEGWVSPFGTGTNKHGFPLLYTFSLITGLIFVAVVVLAALNVAPIAAAEGAEWDRAHAAAVARHQHRHRRHEALSVGAIQDGVHLLHRPPRRQGILRTTCGACGSNAQDRRRSSSTSRARRTAPRGA